MATIRLAKRLATRTKRQHQTCKVFECKIDRSHLSKFAKKTLGSLFKEAKWFYNYVLSHDNISETNCTVKEVPVKVGEEYEIRKFSVLQTQHRQAIKDRTFTSLKSLSSRKKQGYKVGRLKFKSEVNSVPLREYGRTYHLDFKNKRVKIAGLKKKWLRVNGLEQIPEGVDIANATLVKKGQDFYINVTTYQDKQELQLEGSIGIDFGCETQLAFSDGTKVEFQVPTSKRIKRLDRRIMRKDRPRSKKKEQDRRKRQKEYERLTNKRKDIRHKVVNAITQCFKYVCFQDESIHAWHSGNHGKKVQYTGIGGIIGDLKHKSHTPIMVDRFFPSTQLCPSCGNKQKLKLNERTYSCGCGYENDRDVKSAICIEREAMNQVPVDDRDFKAREISTSTFFEKLATVSGIKVSKLESMN
jgi:putative transposase